MDETLSAIVAKLDSMDKKLDQLIAKRQADPAEPRPMSRRQARQLRREQEAEALQAWIFSSLAFVWSLSCRFFSFLAETVCKLMLACGVIGIFIANVTLIHPMIMAFWKHPAPYELIRNMTELVAKLAARNVTDPGL